MPIMTTPPGRMGTARSAARRAFTIATLWWPALIAGAHAQGAVQTSPRQPIAQDARNAQGLTPLIAAASAGQADTVKSLLAGGASVDATSSDGRTALIAAIQNNQINVVPILIAAGANLDRTARLTGTALNVAENAGYTQIAALLLASGAHSTGKSAGDTVCVRTWAGDGFCGVVKSFSVPSVQIQLTRIVGCAHGCDAKEECSASSVVGGTNGLKPGDQIAVPSWCLTQTGVKP